MLITSLDNKNVKHIMKLMNNSSYRIEQNEFVVEGYHLVSEAYKNGYLKELYKLENDPFVLDVVTHEINDKVLNKISNLVHSNQVFGICKIKDEGSLIGTNYLLLDSIQDPGNLGTIIRCAKAFNIDTIVLDNCVSIYNPKVLRATQGIIFQINFINRDLVDVINDLHKNKITVIGTSLNTSNYLNNKNNDNYALVVGNEGNGVRNEVLDMCDEVVKIKINDKVESLNVAIATAIILYELNK